MAVPKKKTSKSKKRIRRNAWLNDISDKVNNALSLGKSLSSEKNNKFVSSVEKLNMM